MVREEEACGVFGGEIDGGGGYGEDFRGGRKEEEGGAGEDEGGGVVSTLDERIGLMSARCL